MKVLFVSREYPPFEVGGIGVHTSKLVQYMTKLGVDCHVISFGDSRFSNDKTNFINPKSSIVEKSYGNLISNVRIPFDIVSFSRATNSMVKEKKIDLIHVEEPYVGGYIKGSSVPKITTFHTTSLGEINALAKDRITGFSLKKMAFYSFLGFYYELLGIVSSSAITVPAMPIRRELENFYRVSEKKIHVIENGVDASTRPIAGNREDAKQKLGIDSDTTLVISVARIVSRKRLDLLVKATKLLAAKKNRKLRVVIVGMGPERDNLLNLVEKYQLQGVVDLPGWISEDQRNLYYQAADIFVLSSDYEGFPLTVLEAMSFGAVIISSQIDSLEGLHDLSDLLFFSPGDHESLSNCIEGVIDNPSLQKQLSLSAKTFASTHSWEEIAKKTKQLYEQFI